MPRRIATSVSSTRRSPPWLAGAAGRRAFELWLALLTVACIAPIWLFRFLPMQDYPQHLFISFVLATYDDPRFNWQQYYDVVSRLGPYTLTYSLTKWLAAAFGIEIAGKLLASAYFLLLATVVVVAAREHGRDRVPWPLLLLFPLSFTPVYYLGFQAYLLSLPILILSLLHLEVWVPRGLGVKDLAIHASLLALLVLLHPFSVLVFLAFSSWAALFHVRVPSELLRAVAPPAILTALLAIWYWRAATAPAPPGIQWSVRWWGAAEIVEFFLLPFTGMRITHGIDSRIVLVWCALAGLLGWYLFRSWSQSRFSKKKLGFLVLSMFGYAVLPFWFGYYGYLNLRLGAVVYLLLPISIASIRLPPVAGHACAVVALGLVIVAARNHREVSRETEEIVPLFARMEKNATVFPLYIDAGTRVLDSRYFYQLHAHDHFYYHTLVGGGGGPRLWSLFLPVVVRDPQALPDFTRPTTREGRRQLPSGYRYVLVRGERSGQWPGALSPLRPVARSGRWALFEDPDPAGNR